MFEGLKGMAGMASLMRDLPRLQARMEEVKASLATLRLESTSAGGTVRVVVTGALEVAEVEINGEPHGDLAQLICVTTNDAIRAAREEVQRRLTEAADELGLPLPPGGLSLPGMG